MMQLRPQSIIDKKFKYFLGGSLLAHAIFLFFVIFYRIFIPNVQISTITLNLGMPGGNGLPVQKVKTVKAPRVIPRHEEKMTIPEKNARLKQAAEQITQQTAAMAGQTGTTETGAGGTGKGTGLGGGQGVVSSNQLDSQPSLVTFRDPVYPVDARKQGREGIVVLKALISPDGKIKEIKIVKPDPVFDKSAVDAVEHWRFSALTSHGRPVYVWMIIPIRFQLK
ncbi:MAG: energy transducer TonB [Deltaproteobacteria bacterium]|nr:energy transducer TonB [Deltaproteobacteria bacterium]